MAKIFDISKIDLEGIELAIYVRRRVRTGYAILVAIVLAIVFYAAYYTNFNLAELERGSPHIWKLLGRMFPPDLEPLSEISGPLVETLQMALVGTTLPIPIAMFLAFYAATSTRRIHWLGNLVRVALNTLRTIPELLWAMILVSAVGLGTFPGTLALTLHSTGSMGKFFYETIEAVDEGILEAMKSTGANRLQIFFFGILPTILPNIMSVVLLYWDYNNRSATVLGLVGAGGIGFILTSAIAEFEYQQAITVLGVIVIILTVIDRTSAAARSRII